MANRAKTDALAVTILDADQAFKATAVGVNLKQAQQALIHKIDDATRLAKVIDSFLDAGTAKTAIGVVVTDLS